MHLGAGKPQRHSSKTDSAAGNQNSCGKDNKKKLSVYMKIHDRVLWAFHVVLYTKVKSKHSHFA